MLIADNWKFIPFQVHETVSKRKKRKNDFHHKVFQGEKKGRLEKEHFRASKIASQAMALAAKPDQLSSHGGSRDFCPPMLTVVHVYVCTQT